MSCIASKLRHTLARSDRRPSCGLGVRRCSERCSAGAKAPTLRHRKGKDVSPDFRGVSGFYKTLDSH